MSNEELQEKLGQAHDVIDALGLALTSARELITAHHKMTAASITDGMCPICTKWDGRRRLHVIGMVLNMAADFKEGK